MEALPPPGPLILSYNAAENWNKFKQRGHFKQTSYEHPSAQKAAVSLHMAGQEAIAVFNTFRHRFAECDAIVQNFEGYCTPPRNDMF
ncbi:hypothetical protein HPB49_011098 [Dermacentor silvarum]|uniref:Uncharacterized protein n=1 Tax=Dermacentor silvarum TaxID=543639 RepID=A0ACB8D4W4_DERSI|nr:hypothetical protein HPB49_011098 [Dermacentor silvarum]